jgi:aconitase A
MVYFSKIASAVAAAWFVGCTVAHPGEHHDQTAVKRQITERDQMASAAKRSIDSCSNSLKHRQVAARSVARRAQAARDLRQQRNIKTSTAPSSMLSYFFLTVYCRA